MDERDAAERAQRAARLPGRDQQHAWMLAGDDRGIYGDYLARV